MWLIVPISVFTQSTGSFACTGTLIEQTAVNRHPLNSQLIDFIPDSFPIWRRNILAYDMFFIFRRNHSDDKTRISRPIQKGECHIDWYSSFRSLRSFTVRFCNAELISCAFP